MKLLVIRHAIAMERSDFRSHGGEDDDRRPLTREGALRMRKNAKGLARLAPSPGILLVSPLTRAMETADILAGVWPKAARETCESLRPDMPPKAFDSWLVKNHRKGWENDTHEVEDHGTCVAIVGHEPHLSRLIGWYMQGEAVSRVRLKKGGACLLDIPDASLGRAKGRLLWLMTPSQLRACR